MLEAIPDIAIGPLTSTALVAAIGDAAELRNGRELAVWLGIVPRQRSTGGRSTLLGIRAITATGIYATSLIHGARSALRTAVRRQNPAQSMGLEGREAP